MNARVTPFATLVLLPAALFAQDSASKTNPTPFRKGQWAAQFQVGSAFTSLGFIKFRSPTHALVLDVRLSGAHSETSDSDSTGSHFANLNSWAWTQLRFGWRRYRGGEPTVAAHYTLGLLAGFDHNASRDQNSSFQRNGWTAGLFGDIGATYLATSRLGLGALASASLFYTTSTAHSQPYDTKDHMWQIGGSALTASIVATLFF